MSMANFLPSVGATREAMSISARPAPEIQNGAYSGAVGGTGGGLSQGMQARQHYGQGLQVNYHNGSGGDPHHSQRRSGRWRSNGGSYLQQVRSRFRSFRSGSSKYFGSIRPSREDILRGSVAASGGPSLTEQTPEQVFIPGVDAVLPEEERAVNDMLLSVQGRGHGFVEDRKPSGVVRLFAENVNSLSLFEPKLAWKMDRIKAINKRYQTDAALLVEYGTDFRHLPEDASLQYRLGDIDCRCSAANNVTEPSGRSQYGGTAVFTYQRLSGFYLDSGKDETGLGRWAWILVGTPDRRTRIVTAYRPVKPPWSILRDRRLGWHKVWNQHRRYFRKKGIAGSPRELFVTHLVEQLLEWRSQGDEIVLFLDANEHAVTGELPRRLAEPDLLMAEQFSATNGYDGPPSYFRGSRPIDGCYCTSAVDCMNVLLSPTQSGAGDHRFWIIDIDATSMLGSGYARLVRPKGRRLKCTVERTRISYNKDLLQLSIRHRMFDKMDSLLQAVDSPDFSSEEVRSGLNAFDREHIQQQYASENRCNHFKNDFLDFSPTVNVWIKRKELFSQLMSINARRRAGKRSPTSHFLRACSVHGIDDPFSLSDEEIRSRHAACVQRLRELRPVARPLRDHHLKECRSRAKERGDDRAVRRITQIMRDERSRRRWRGVRRATGVRRGGAPTEIRVQASEDAPEMHLVTRPDVEAQAARRLTSRFKLARDSPICEGRIFDDVGYLGDTTSTRAILEGTYEFPPEMDPHLRLLLEEAHKVFSQRTTEEISTFVSTEDFQYYWRRADEFVQSSYSNIHFGHYKAIAHDRFLSSLQAAKLSLSARTGIPLDRWGSSLTVLIEKEFGNIYLEKMRAIVLLEADMNWLNKLVFAKRMMDQAYDNGMVPPEQFARRGTQAAHGVLSKVLFCDIVRALHVVAGLPSVDLGNCYDAVAHPLASIALQAFMVPLAMVTMSLAVLQTMQFFLRTGYGVSETGYGGTAADPTFGLGQGNGMAPSGFQTVSTLMTRAYNRLGHSARLTGVWSGIVFVIAAIIYVDDTDLLLVASSRQQSLTEFFHQAQSAVMDWGLITQATGGYLKPTKCFWYLMAWRWQQGRPILRRAKHLPKFRMVVPQKDGSVSVIPLKDVEEVQETLGVWSCPAGEFGVHVTKKLAEGARWADRLRSNRCPPADGWMGFRHALIPKLTYGFSAITPDPSELEEGFQELYFKLLSPLRVNCRISKFFRMAPKRYFGLGMPNPGILMLSHKLQLLHTQFNMPTSTGQMLRQSWEVFQMEVGLSSNILCEDYSRLGNLATGGWWKQLWCLCHKFRVRISFGLKFLIPLLRVGDRSLMDVICETDLYSPSDREIINRVRKFLGVHSLADVVLCDGRTIDPVVLGRRPLVSSREFSVEHPTPSDFRLFRQAVINLSSQSFTLRTTLGPYVATPHRSSIWFASPCRRFLYKASSESSYTQFRRLSSRPTRHGTRYGSPVSLSGQCPREYYASVTVADSGGLVTLHSTAAAYVPSPIRRSFWQRLRALPNQSLWKSLCIDGDGTWIYDGIMRGTLILMSDGSYNDRLATDVCSCAAIIRCKATGHTASVTWVEKTNNHSATNYRGEILGGIALQLLLQVALDGKYVSSLCRVRIGCDNKGVVHHGNHPYRPLGSSQKQADLLRYYKQLAGESRAKCVMYHVFGHLDDLLEEHERTDEENVNVECDHLAEAALAEGVSSLSFIDSIFPNEDIVAMVDDQKITGLASDQIARHWGHGVAREHFVSKGIIPADLFDSVYWDGVERVMATSPEMFSVWASKQTSGTCGVNHMLKNFQVGVVDACPNCGSSPERTSHIYSCQDPHRTSLFHESVTSLAQWLAAQRTDHELLMLITQYLRARGRRTMTSLCSPFSRYRRLATIQDGLGFDNFLEGRIPSLFRLVRQQDISRRKLRKHAGHWCNGLILRLLQVTHRQWSYRNGSTHLQVRDGMTMTQHRALTRRCEELLWTDPTQLLPEDQCLLNLDFAALGSGNAVVRQLWISEMEAATAAAQYDRRQQRQARLEARLTREPPPIDTEGSIRFRRRRRRFSWSIGYWLTQFPVWKRVLSLTAQAVALYGTMEKKGAVYTVLLCLDIVIIY